MNEPSGDAPSDTAKQPYCCQCHNPPSVRTPCSPCPEAPATSLSAAGQQTPATSGSGSPVGSGQPDAGWQSEGRKRKKCLIARQLDQRQ